MKLTVKVQPRASRDRVEAQPDGTLKVWTTAAPTGGQANARVCELVAEHLGLPRRRVTLARGHSSRNKVLAVAED